VCVQNINAIAAQKSRERENAGWKLSPAATIATETLDALSLHIVAQPGSHRIEGSEEHLIATSILPCRELREKPACVAVLRKVQDTLSCLLFL